MPLAQIVLPGGASATYRGVAGTTDGMEFPFTGTVTNVIGERPIITPINLGEVVQSTIITAQLLAANGPSVWSGLTPAAGSPAIAATLSADGNFSWDPTSSARGPKGNGVLYSWMATATNAQGADTNVAITLLLVPEPATVLFAIMVTCCSTRGARPRFCDNRSGPIMPCCAPH
jgi:hypothetical protein